MRSDRGPRTIARIAPSSTVAITKRRPLDIIGGIPFSPTTEMPRYVEPHRIHSATSGPQMASPVDRRSGVGLVLMVVPVLMLAPVASVEG